MASMFRLSLAPLNPLQGRRVMNAWGATSLRGVMVSITAFQAVDTGSIPVAGSGT